MSINVTTYPRITKTEDPLEVSRWGALHQMGKWVFSRRDYVINTITSASVDDSTVGIIVDLYSDVDPITEIEVGQTVYISSGAYAVSGVVTAFSGTTITLGDVEYLGDSAGGYCNLITARRNYVLEIQVVKLVGVAWVVAGTTENRPAADGTLTFDAHPLLRSLADLADDCDYDQVNQRQEDLGGPYNLRYRETWTGKAEEDEYTTLPQVNIHYYVNAAKQLQEEYGVNMAQYVTFPPDDASVPAQHSYAEFLSEFDRPTYFPGFPFSLCFIYSENIADYGTHKMEESFNGNEVSQGTSDEELDSNQALFVNALTMDGGYSEIIKSIDVWLEVDTDETGGIEYYEADTVEESFVETVSVVTLQESYSSPL